ncbi:MAG TPA: alpha/beta fold hydrolase [bacterium]|nr:alpha/beta fold hydrolase [bacterium]
MVTKFGWFSRILLGFFLVLIGAGKGWSQDHASTGIILLHGKNGMPSGHIAKLAEALRDKGYVVSTPTMPWAKGAIYSAGYDESLKLINREVSSLRAKGLKNIIVAGHSLGAHMALAYAGTDSTLAGVILLAPGHYPENAGPKHPSVLNSVEKAKSLVAEGKIDQTGDFDDVNNGSEISVSAKPADYLSFCDPDGTGTMEHAVGTFHHSLPVLLISESSPRVDPKETIFDALPSNDKSRFVQSGASHMDVPDDSVDTVLNWLKSLSL